MKKAIALLALLSFLLNTNAQQHKVDSLNKIINTATVDTVKIQAMANITKLYMYSKPDTCMVLALQIMQLSKKINYLKGEAQSLNIQGIAFTNTGNYPKAMQAQLAALKIQERRNVSIDIIKILNNLGVTATRAGEVRQSINYNLEAMALSESNHYEAGIALANINVGDNYEKLNMLDSARICTQRGYELVVKLNDIDLIATANNNLGNIYAKMNNPGVALGYYRTSLPLWKQAGDDEGPCETALGMAKLFKLSGQNDSCLYYARLAMTTGKTGDFPIWVLKAGKFLSSYFEDQGKIDSAYHYQKIAIATNESLFSQEKTKELQNQAFEEKQRQAEIAEQKLTDEEHFKKNLQLAGIAVFIPTFFLLVLLLSRRKLKPRMVEFLGILSLLMFFEFITLLVHPYVEHFTHDTPVFSLLILVAIAALIVPMHHRAEHWIKSKLLHGGHQVHKAG